MEMFSAWLTIFAVSLIAVITPGPDFMLTLRSSLVYSRQAGIYTAIGVGAGNMIHATYCLIGIGAVISKSILLFNALKWIGAAYLIYIGIKSLTTKRVVASAKMAEPKRQINPWIAFRIGLLGNLLNPKATLFFLALFTQIVRPSTPILIQAAYGMTVVVLALTWFSIVAVVISQQALRNRILSFSHWLERLTGAALVALGFRLAIAEATE